MSKSTDDKIEAAARHDELVAPEPPEPRLHKVPDRVSEDDIAVIRHLVCRYAADMAIYDDGIDGLTGRSVSSICQAWLRIEAAAQSKID